MGQKRTMEKMIEEAYSMLSEEKEGIIQSQLWKGLGITSREGSRIAKELEKRKLALREKTLYDGRWTYRLSLRTKPLEIGMIKDIYCFQCEYEQKCSAESPAYLRRCRYIEEWAMRRYREKLEERHRDVSEVEEGEEERPLPQASEETWIQE